MKRAFKKIILITGATGLLGSYFLNKYKKKYNIIKYPYRIEKTEKFKNWIAKKKFEYFIHFAGISKGHKRKLSQINTKSSINILKKLKKKK